MLTDSAKTVIMYSYKPNEVVEYDAENEGVIFLPLPLIGRSIEILQLSDFPITLDTNSDDTRFIFRSKPRRLVINGGPDVYGKNLILTVHNGHWRIQSTTLSDTQLNLES